MSQSFFFETERKHFICEQEHWSNHTLTFSSHAHGL